MLLNAILIFGVILFIIWQFHVILKYQFKCDAIRIDKYNKLLSINKININYTDVKTVEITKDEIQPSIIERALSKGAFCVYNTNLKLYLADDTVKNIRCNSKQMLKKIIKELQQYANIINNAGEKDDDFTKSVLYSVVICLIIIFLLSILCYMPH